MSGPRRKVAARALRCKGKLRVRWTHEQDNYLRVNWAACSLQVIARKLQRPEGSVCARARKLKLRARHGIVKIHTLSKRTGYSPSRIVGAAEHLGLSVTHVPRLDVRQKRTPSHRGLDEEDAEKVLEYLALVPDGEPLYRERGGKTKAGVWGVGDKPAVCKGHKLADEPHYADGYCGRCYERRRSRRRRGLPVDDAQPDPQRRTGTPRPAVVTAPLASKVCPPVSRSKRKARKR